MVFEWPKYLQRLKTYCHCSNHPTPWLCVQNYNKDLNLLKYGFWRRKVETSPINHLRWIIIFWASHSYINNTSHRQQPGYVVPDKYSKYFSERVKKGFTLKGIAMLAISIHIILGHMVNRTPDIKCNAVRLEP